MYQQTQRAIDLTQAMAKLTLLAFFVVRSRSRPAFWHKFHCGAGEVAHLGLVCGLCASVDSGRCVLVAGYTRGGWEGMETGLSSEEDETNMRDDSLLLLERGSRRFLSN